NAARINSGGGPITVTGTGTGSAIGIQLDGTGGSADIASASNATVGLIADTMSLDSGTTSISAGTGIVNLRQKTNGKPIDLGGADSATQLGLTDSELDRVTASTMNIGDANTSNVQVDAVITQ